jgi:NAD-dependent DNA ligase
MEAHVAFLHPENDTQSEVENTSSEVVVNKTGMTSVTAPCAAIKVSGSVAKAATVQPPTAHSAAEKSLVFK